MKLSLGECHRFSKGIFAWVGYETRFIPYVAQDRLAGTTKRNSRKLLYIGLIGEYVGRTFVQSKDCPIYLTKEILTYEKQAKAFDITPKVFLLCLL